MSHRTLSTRLLRLAAAAALAFALPAQALTVIDVQDGGNLVSTAFVGAGLVGLDVGLLTSSPVRVTLSLDAEDIGRNLSFNAIVSLLQQPAAAVIVGLDGASLAALGSATALDADVRLLARTDLRGAAATASVASSEFYLGNPLLEGLQDWRIALADARAGDRFSVTISAVPEPGSWALMLSGLVAAACAGRHHRGEHRSRA